MRRRIRQTKKRWKKKKRHLGPEGFILGRMRQEEEEEDEEEEEEEEAEEEETYLPVKVG